MRHGAPPAWSWALHPPALVGGMRGQDTVLCLALHEARAGPNRNGCATCAAAKSSRGSAGNSIRSWFVVDTCAGAYKLPLFAWNADVQLCPASVDGSTSETTIIITS